MSETLTVALAQINPTVGDLDGNLERIRVARAEAAGGGADLAVFPELVVAGYPPEDLVLKRAFQDSIAEAVAELARDTADGGPGLLIGAPWRESDGLYNAALLLDGGRVAAARFKHMLPNYGVFDEKRVFAPGPLPEPVAWRGARLGVMVCEDMWSPEVAAHLAGRGADILVVINGSPFEIGKTGDRRRLAGQRTAETGLGLIYLNLVGGQDELVFDGASFVLDPAGRLRVQAPAWEKRVVASRWSRDRDGPWSPETGPLAELPGSEETVYRALCTGLRDYVGKNGFPGVVIGLSGGIDSALTAAIAVDALGAARVRCVMMPSPHTSDHSIEDAAHAARLLGVDTDIISIEPAMEAFSGMLAKVFAGRQADETEENIQARARGMVLMALSNKLGNMVLNTSNKSESSVGYTTLYGDLCGGFSVLKDVYKTTVGALARWRNAHRPGDALGPQGRLIPERILTKPPSAELRPDQTDQDSLPPYEDLDAILECLIEKELSRQDTVAQGFDGATVSRVWRLLHRAEYKRRQGPPGVKITPRSFGRDRRYPITNRFTEQG